MPCAGSHKVLRAPCDGPQISSPNLSLVWQDSHQQQKLKAANQELVAKNLSLQIENEELAEKLEKHEVCLQKFT